MWGFRLNLDLPFDFKEPLVGLNHLIHVGKGKIRKATTQTDWDHRDHQHSFSGRSLRSSWLPCIREGFEKSIQLNRWLVRVFHDFHDLSRGFDCSCFIRSSCNNIRYSTDGIGNYKWFINWACSRTNALFRDSLNYSEPSSVYVGRHASLTVLRYQLYQWVGRKNVQKKKQC
jgi:hypothetical protein